MKPPMIPTPAKTKIAAIKLPASNFLETSPTRAGASAVAGADCAGAGAGAFATVRPAGCSFAGSVFANAGASSRTWLEAGAFAAATGVSTTGEKFGAGDVGISSGLPGLPAANDPGAAPEDCVTAELARGSSGLGAVASIPAIAGAAVLVFASAAFPFATAAPGIGLGSIAGLDSVCASAKAVAASTAGAGEVASAGLCIQPRS